jgi:hypothetical protein
MMSGDINRGSSQPPGTGAHSLAGLVPRPAVAAYAGNSVVNGEPAGPLLALAVLAGSLSHVLATG